MHLTIESEFYKIKNTYNKQFKVFIVLIRKILNLLNFKFYIKKKKNF